LWGGSCVRAEVQKIETPVEQGADGDAKMR
jgi:hypothetical protein